VQKALQYLQTQAIAFKLLQSLNNCVNVSSLERTWNKNILNEKPIIPEGFKFWKNLASKAFACL
jgi:hypothetical protein